MGFKDRAEKAREKKAKYGVDIELGGFSQKPRTHKKIASLSELPEPVTRKSESVGIAASKEREKTLYFQQDESVLADRGTSDIEVMSLTSALKKHGWLKDYMWKAVDVDQDKFTAEVELEQMDGYFIRAKKGARTKVPVQACLYISQPGTTQRVHNVIIAEEGSKLDIITGCASHDVSALHIGISEFYVKKNASINFTMLHGWGKGVHVRPRSGAIVEENGRFVTNYVCIQPVKSLQLNPRTRLVGRKAAAKFRSILLGQNDSHMDVGSVMVFEAPETRAEQVAHVAAKDKARVVSRGLMLGKTDDCKGHLECRGLLLGEKASIYAVPELDARREGADLSHEAAVGKIDEAQLNYLMSRGLTRDDAVGLIVKGFLDPDVKGMPEGLKEKIREHLEKTAEGL